MIGSLIISGFEGPELSEDTINFFAQSKVGGVILQGGNCESPAQIIELVNSIQERGETPSWILMEHEGGKAQKLKPPFTRFPSPAEIGRTDSPKLAFELAEVVAAELAAVGVNVNLAPIANTLLASTTANFQHERYFSESEDNVEKMVSAWVRGHLLKKVQPCVRQYPDKKKPFSKAFRSKCQWVQVAPDFSFPRDEFRYDGLVLSADLNSSHDPIKVLKAGCDLLLYRKEEDARKAVDRLVRAVEEGILAPQDIQARTDRILAAKTEQLSGYIVPDVADISKTIGIEAHQTLAQKFV